MQFAEAWIAMDPELVSDEPVDAEVELDSPFESSTARLLIASGACAVGVLFLAAIVGAEKRDALDAAVATMPWMVRFESNFGLWFLLLAAIRQFCAPLGLGSICVIALLIAIRRRNWRPWSNALTAVALLLWLLAAMLHPLFHRLSPTRSLYSFPDIDSAGALAFYGLAAWIVRRHRIYAIILGTAGVVFFAITAGTFLYYGYAWPTDILAGALLGGVIAFPIAAIYDSFFVRHFQ